MPEKLLLTRAEIAAWLGITADQAKRLPLPTLPVMSRGQGIRRREVIARDAVLRYLGSHEEPDTPPFVVRPERKRRR